MSKTIGRTAVGIDLGTTYSCVAAWFDKHNRMEMIPNEQGNKITPSCVAWDGTQILVGEAAKNQINRNPKNTVFDVKRLMGSGFNDSKVHEDIKSWPFKVIEGSEGKPLLVFEHESQEKKFSPQDISALILKNLKETAEAYLGTKVIDAPTSASIAYGLDKSADINSPNDKSVCIFDMGGGTFDVSLLNISKDGTFIVKAVGGDTYLGGEDFDKMMVNYYVQEFRKKEKKDVRINAREMTRLKVACEKAKRDLSSITITSIEINSLYEGIDFSIKITRARFEELNSDFFNKCIEHVETCLRDGGMSKKDVNDVVSINADEAVAYGAAALASKLCGNGNKKVKDLIILDVTPRSLGIQLRYETMNVVIPRNTPIPTMKERVYNTYFDNQVSAEFKVYQGESNNIRENILLGSFVLDDIPAAPAGKQKLKVCFNIDSNGIINVSAEVISTVTSDDFASGSSGKSILRLDECWLVWVQHFFLTNGSTAVGGECGRFCKGSASMGNARLGNTISNTKSGLLKVIPLSKWN
ncbi:heat shock cognate 70 kDa protein-like protein [Tanacetum coccineum]